MLYEVITTRLDAALAQDFSGDGVAQVSSDFLFGHLGRDAQVEAWKQFANTMKLKLWLHQTKVNDAAAGVAIAALLTEGNFLTQDANVITSYSIHYTKLYDVPIVNLQDKRPHH